MKWLWLAVLPYVVTASTWEAVESGGSVIMTEYRVGSMQCPGTKEECADMAEALNEAHERRTQTIPPALIEGILLKDNPCPFCVDSKAEGRHE